MFIAGSAFFERLSFPHSPGRVLKRTPRRIHPYAHHNQPGRVDAKGAHRKIRTVLLSGSLALFHSRPFSSRSVEACNARARLWIVYIVLYYRVSAFLKLDPVTTKMFFHLLSLSLSRIVPRFILLRVLWRESFLASLYKGWPCKIVAFPVRAFASLWSGRSFVRKKSPGILNNARRCSGFLEIHVRVIVCRSGISRQYNGIEKRQPLLGLSEVVI